MTSAAKVYTRRQKTVAILRGIVLVAGIYQLLWGELSVGVGILLALAAIMSPGLVTRNRVRAVPLEFELLLFLMVILQLVIGETLNFYDLVPYYDKLVHFSLPLFLGFMVSLLTYTMYVTGNLRTTVAPALFIIILVTIGVGAVWEIIEYLSDKLTDTYLQGSSTADPLTDTMNDLITDTLGGVFGALLALRYIRAGVRDKNSRLIGLTDELAEDFGGGTEHVAKP
jgi:uncharacterized membrane protein